MPHSNSGAGRIKDDAHDDDFLIEVKDARSSFVLNGKELRGLYVRAVRQDRTAKMVVRFTDLGFDAEVHLIPSRRDMI